MEGCSPIPGLSPPAYCACCCACCACCCASFGLCAAATAPQGHAFLPAVACGSGSGGGSGGRRSPATPCPRLLARSTISVSCVMPGVARMITSAHATARQAARCSSGKDDHVSPHHCTASSVMPGVARLTHAIAVQAAQCRGRGSKVDHATTVVQAAGAGGQDLSAGCATVGLKSEEGEACHCSWGQSTGAWEQERLPQPRVCFTI